MIFHIARREFTALGRSKGIIYSTVVIVAIILIASVVVRFTVNESDEGDAAEQEKATIAIEAQMADYQPYLEQVTQGGAITVEQIPSGQATENIKEADDDRIAVGGEVGSPRIFVASDSSLQTQEQLTDVVRLATAHWLIDRTGGSLDETNQEDFVRNIQLATEEVNTSSFNPDELDPVSYVSAMVGLFLLFFAIVSGVSVISIGVVEEKSSRVVEILLSIMKPRQLLTGKILGISLGLLVQYAIIVLALLAGIYIAGFSWVLDFSLGTFFIWIVVWMILGFIFYVTIVGALSATASRQEDLGPITGTITFMLFIPFYTAFFLVPMFPDELWLRILSMVPGFSPFLMLERQAFGGVPVIDVIIALVLAVAAIPLVFMLAGKIYQNSVLHMGARVPIMQAIRGTADKK